MTFDISRRMLARDFLDGNIIAEFEKNLKAFQEQNPSGCLLSLSSELSNDANDINWRRLAAIVLKNSIDPKYASMPQLWMTIDTTVKSQIKESLLKTLESSTKEARHMSAQVLAKIAAIEIPIKQWPDFIPLLLSNMTQSNISASLKEGTLKTLQCVCEEMSHEGLEQTEVNDVLTAVARGMDPAQNTTETCVAATKALCSALALAQTNFRDETDRDYIMKAVYDTATSPDILIREAAYECLVAIASMYYELLAPHMQYLYGLTSEAMKVDNDPVDRKAVEFWTSICYTEIEIQESYGDDSDQSQASSSHFINQASPCLVPILLDTLLKKNKDEDPDHRSCEVSKAAVTCLCLIARIVGDSVVLQVMSFVEVNAISQDSHYREAAILALRSIIDGPKMEILLPRVQSFLNILRTFTKDQNDRVRDMTACTLSRIFELLHSHAHAPGFSSITFNIQPVSGVLLESLKDTPSIAEKICGAIFYLAPDFKYVECNSLVLIRDIIASLIATADRTDAPDDKLRNASYKALNEIVRCAEMPATALIIIQLFQLILKKLSLSFNLEQEHLQTLLWSVLQVIIQKLNTKKTKHIIIRSADYIMRLILKSLASRSALVHKEAMLAVGALVYPTAAMFVKYMPDFFKYLQMGLQNHKEYHVCSITVGVIGDICRALKDKILPYCNVIVSFLVKNLSSGELHRSVKPAIISCFGDIALAIRAQFEKYLCYVIPMMQSASEVCAKMDTGDNEIMEFGNLLRRSIFEAYFGILQGFKDAKPELFVPHGKHLLLFVEFVFRDKEREQGVMKAAIGVLGTLADSPGPYTNILLENCSVCMRVIQECLKSDDPQLKDAATRIQGLIGRMIMALS